ncbi:unnamed protein product, partial [Rotaria magnacalcarata]
IRIEKVFEETLSQKHHFRLNETELSKMNQYRQEELKKKSDQKMNMLGLTSDLSALLKKKSKVDTHPQHLVIKVNIEYLNILLPHLKHYNAYCALCICTRYFGKNISQPTTLLLRCTLKCSGHVLNNGYCVLIATNRKIFHRVNEKISRPIRGSQRRAIMDKFKAGGSAYRIHPQYDEKITIHGKKVFPHKKNSFPRPAIILSDHAALYVFNDENYSAFLARANRIVTNEAIRNDLSKTNIHAYLSHFMLDKRKRVNKSTWPIIKDNWRFIYQVFLTMFQMITLISNNIMQHCFLVLVK